METSELVDEEKTTRVGPEKDGTRMVHEHAQTRIQREYDKKRTGPGSDATRKQGG